MPDPNPTEPPILDHEYDGIREYDSPMPRWWTLMFWATFVFSIGYVVFYASGRGQSVAAEYSAELSEAREHEARRALGEKPTEQGLAQLSTNGAMMADAKALFAERCVPCHGDQAQGTIGPNLTDSYWIHGQGSLLDIYEVIASGVPQKGMPAWSKQLTPIEVAKLSAYVGSIKNTNVPGKAPEGNRFASR